MSWTSNQPSWLKQMKFIFLFFFFFMQIMLQWG